MESNWKLIVKYMACRDCLRANNKKKKKVLDNYTVPAPDGISFL